MAALGPLTFALGPPRQTGYPLMIDYKEYITIEPGKRSGKPCIRGLQITVYDILNMLADGKVSRRIMK